MTSKRYNAMATAFAHELHTMPDMMPAAWAIINVWMGFEKDKNPRFDKERFTAYVWEKFHALARTEPTDSRYDMASAERCERIG